MKKWALIVDAASCINCQNCVLATQDEYQANEHPGYAAAMPAAGAAWMRIHRHTRGDEGMLDVSYVPVTCHQCGNAPCMKSGSDGAIYRRPDGIVIIDPVRARGRRELVDACPFGAISWNEEAGLPQKWYFDAHLLDAGWSQPRAVQACPTGALHAVCLEDAELEDLSTAQQLEPFVVGTDTQPRVLYRNLRPLRTLFLGGTVTRSLPGGGTDNVADARVELLVDDAPMGATSSDSFGDFRIDGIPARTLDWVLRIRHPELGEANLRGSMERSRYLGPVLLEPP